MTTIPEKCRAIEAELKAHKISLNRFLKHAGSNWTSWRRWYRGDVLPRMDNWEKLEKAFHDLAGISLEQSIERQLDIRRILKKRNS